ncbi:aquIMA [Symbiodinium sp. CCMP2456]|nr:aquIMA [Symbiodinium sp. CCMP2456]
MEGPLGDLALREVQVGSSLDLVVTHVKGHVFRGIWHGDLYSCDTLEPGTWTLYGYILESIDRNVGKLRGTIDSRAFPKPEYTADAFRTMVEVCAGIGGLGLGARFAGTEILLQVDKAPIAYETLRLNGGNALLGDIGARDTQARIAQICQGRGHVLAAGLPCTGFSSQGLRDGALLSGDLVLTNALQIAWRCQVAGVILECGTQIQQHKPAMDMIGVFAQRMHYQTHQVSLDLSDQWASRRPRWWCILLPNQLPPLHLPPWPIAQAKLVIADVIEEWPLWPLTQEEGLAWTPDEEKLYADPVYGSTNRYINTQEQAPVALHCWGSEMQPCPCGCRPCRFTDAALRAQGLKGVGVLAAGLSGTRFLHASEVGFLNSLPATFLHLPDPRAALCLAGQLTAPLQSLWISAHIHAWAESAFGLPGLTDPCKLLQAFKDSLLESRRDSWLIPSLQNAACLRFITDSAMLEMQVAGPTRVNNLVQAEKELQGPGVLVLVFEGDRRLPPYAFLHPARPSDCYHLVIRPKSAGKSAPQQTLKAPETTGTTDVTIWTGLLRLQAASAQHFFVVPPTIVTNWLRLAWLHQEAEGSTPFTWPSGCKAVLLPFLWEKHWSLLVLQRADSGEVSATLHDGVPGHSSAAAQGLASLVCRSCGLPEPIVEAPPLPVQHQPNSCGPMILAFAAQVMQASQPFSVLLEDAINFCRFVPPHQSSMHGYGGLSEAQQLSLRTLLLERGVPEPSVTERIQAATQRIGAGSLAKCLQADNPWQALKAAGSQPNALFRWIRPEELQAHAQAKAAQRFGTAVGNAKERKQKQTRSQKPVLNVDPLSLQLAAGSFVSGQNSPLSQLAFDEVVSQAQGIAFCTAQQMMPFITAYRVLSVDALALVSTAPLPTEVCAGAPVSQIRFPAVFSPTQEAVLLSGSMLQLGDEHVQLSSADADMGEIDQLDTVTGRVSLFRDEAQLDWEVFIKAPIRSLLQHVPGLNLCRDKNCKGDCAAFHPAVDEHVEHMLLDVWARQFAKLDGGKADPASAQVFQSLIRVPSSASKHLQHINVSGFYFEPRAATGFGPHPSFAVVWLPGKDKAQVTHLLRTCDKAIGLARLGSKYGLRVPDEHEQAVFQELRPQHTFVKVRVLSRWRLHPLPHGMQRHTLAQLLGKWKWAAKPLQPCKGDSSGCAWEVGSAEEPPASIMQAGDSFVLIHKTKDVGPQAKPDTLCASNRTRRRILYDDPDVPSSSSDPWAGGQDPWSLARPPPGLPAPATSAATGSATPSAAVSKLSQVKTELQSNLATLVRKEVQAATSAASIPDPVSDERIQKLEVGLKEVRVQNSRFEEWFQKVGSEMQQQAQQVAEVQQIVASQKAELGSLRSDVSTSILQAVTALRNDMSDQFATQTASLEAMLSKKQRSEPSFFFRLLLWVSLIWVPTDARQIAPFRRYGEASNPGPEPLISFGTSNPSGLRGKEQHVADLGPGIWQLSETQLSAISLPSSSRALKALTAALHRDVRIFAGAPAPLRTGSSFAGSWTGVLTLSDYPCRPVQLQWLHDSFHTGRIQALHHFVHDTPILTANVYGFPSGKTYVDARARTERLLETLTHELVLGRKGIRMISGDFNHWHAHLDQVQIWKQQGWIEAQELAALRWQQEPVPTCKGSTHRDFIFLSPEAAALCGEVRVTNTFAEHATVIAGIRLTGVHRVQSWPFPAEIPWADVDVPSWTEACAAPSIHADDCHTDATAEHSFHPSFPQWWPRRPVQLVGSPQHLPHWLPSAEVCRRLFLDFRDNYRKFEAWNVRQRQAILTEQYAHNRDLLFRDLRDPRPEQVDTLELRKTYHILAVEPSTCSVHLDAEIDERGCSQWQLDGCTVQVTEISGDLCRIPDCPALHAEAELEQTTVLSSAVHVQNEFEKLWSSFWKRSFDPATTDWSRITAFAQAFLPKSRLELPPIDLAQWRAALKRFKPRAARGADGLARLDLIHMPDCYAQIVLNFLSDIESGVRPWPAQWLIGLVCCLKKPNERQDTQGYRPICLLSCAYRAWSGIRARQALRWLAGLLPPTALGFMPQREASQFWWLLEAQIELACQSDLPLAGYCTDVIKAFNALPRQPVFDIAEWIGMPTNLLSPWQCFLSGLERRFIIRREVGEAVTSTVGFPEGCALSTVGMSLVCLCFHAYIEAFTSQAVPHSYVDNLCCTAQSVGQLAAGINVSRTFLDMFSLSTDEDKTYVWAVRPDLRQQLKGLGIRIVDHARELGGYISFGRATKNSDLVQRCHAMAPWFGRLKRSPCAFREKLYALPAKFWAYALHGIAGCPLADAHFASLRAQAVRALGCNTAGSSSMLRLSTCGTMEADPGFYQLWCALRDLRRMAAKNDRVLSLWRAFMSGFQGQLLPGPFSKLLQVLGQIGWRVDTPPCIVDHEGFEHNLLLMPSTLLRKLSEQAWLNYVASRHRHRSTMHDLHGIDLSLLEADTGRFSALNQARLAALRSGAFMFGTSLSKFDATNDGLCPSCGIPDTPEHRVCHCPRFAAARCPYSWVCAEWPNLPECLRTHLLPPSNPHLPALHTQLSQLPDRSAQFASSRCTDGPQHVFCDGSCLLTTTPSFALAAWGCVNATTGDILACGSVPGLAQTAQRAELWGAIASLKWGLRMEASLTLWTDSTMVGKGIRRLLCGLDMGDSENLDLWQLLAELVAAFPAGQLIVQHVPSHLDPARGTSPFEDWLIQWNGYADTVAGLTNLNRSAALRQAHEQALDWHTRMREALQALRGIYFGIADITSLPGRVNTLEVELEEPELPQLVSEASPGAPFAEELPVTWRQIIQQACPELPRPFLEQLGDFLVVQSQAAGPWRRLSWLELVFMILEAGAPCFPVRALDSDRWLSRADVPLGAPALTVAVQMSLLRKALRRIFVALRRVDLLVDGISLVEFGVTFRIGGLLFPSDPSLLRAAHERLFQFCMGRKVVEVLGPVLDEWATQPQLATATLGSLGKEAAGVGPCESKHDTDEQLREGMGTGQWHSEEPEAYRDRV